MAKVGAIVQARTSSTRLPGKVLLDLPYGSGVTVLEQVVRRIKGASAVEEVAIATTEHREDDVIVEIAERIGVKWFRGSRDDVLGRYYHCARENGYGVVVRITSDCPCVDPDLIDTAVEAHLKERADYTAVKEIPVGLNVEVLSFSALETAHREAKEAFEREHVCPYIHTTRRERFRVLHIPPPEEIRAPDIRVTLDTEEDYALLCAVFDYLGESFSARELVQLFVEKPWLKLVNRKVMQKRLIRDLGQEIEEAVKLLRLQELNRAAEILERWRDRG